MAYVMVDASGRVKPRRDGRHPVDQYFLFWTAFSAVYATLAHRQGIRTELVRAEDGSVVTRPNGGVRIPEVVWPLTARRVLTLEWIDGTPIADIAALDQRGVDRKALAKLVIAVFLKQALHTGFFHADMHQGNLLIDRMGRLALVDFGIMGR